MRHVTTPALGFALLLAACAGSTPTQPPLAAGPTAGPAGQDDPVEVCRAMFARQYECRAVFIPALVDLRIKHDAPKGIAAMAAKPGGRDELIAIAQKEYDTDGVEPKRSETCRAVAPRFPPEVVAAAKKCAAATDCASLIACVAPLQDMRIKAQAEAEAGR